MLGVIGVLVVFVGLPLYAYWVTVRECRRALDEAARKGREALK